MTNIEQIDNLDFATIIANAQDIGTSSMAGAGTALAPKEGEEGSEGAQEGQEAAPAPEGEPEAEGGEGGAFEGDAEKILAACCLICHNMSAEVSFLALDMPKELQYVLMALAKIGAELADDGADGEGEGE